MDSKEFWTAIAILLAGVGFTVSPWHSLWIAVPVWSLAVLVLAFVWRDDVWEWSESLRRKPRWSLSPAPATRTPDDRVMLGLYVQNPQRDGEFYARIEDTRGLIDTARPPWDIPWRTTRSRHTIGFKDREIINLVAFKQKSAGKAYIPHADSDTRPEGDKFSEPSLSGCLADVAFLVSVRRANRQAVLQRWVQVVVKDKTIGFKVLDGEDEP